MAHVALSIVTHVLARGSLKQAMHMRKAMFRLRPRVTRNWSKQGGSFLERATFQFCPLTSQGGDARPPASGTMRHQSPLL